MKLALQILFVTCISAHGFLLLSPARLISPSSSMTPPCRQRVAPLHASFFKSLLGGGDDPQTLVRRCGMMQALNNWILRCRCVVLG